jgi:hypothetical protein
MSKDSGKTDRVEKQGKKGNISKIRNQQGKGNTKKDK